MVRANDPEFFSHLPEDSRAGVNLPNYQITHLPNHGYRHRHISADSSAIAAS
jgi:hypothetical protein